MQSSTSTSTSTLSPPPPTYHQLKACQFSSWYSTFRNLQTNQQTFSSSNNNNIINNNNNNENPRNRIFPYNNVTIRSIIIKPLPMDFLEYLKSDGVRLPLGAEKVSSFLPELDSNTNRNGYDGDDWSSEDDHNDIDDNDNDKNDDHDDHNDKTENNQIFHFPQLNKRIQNAIDTLGGTVIPKLNWSCPKDVTWINSGSLKCSTVGDVYLLLQSSDFCMFDLNHALDDISDFDGNVDTNLDFELVLRKWSNLHPSMEFRCFVSSNDLVAISQRHHSQHFPHLKNDFMIIRSQIIEFFLDTVQFTFANNTVHDYVFDVYIDKNDRVWLIDFNVWANRTDSLLFTWDEIIKLSQNNVSDGKDDNSTKDLEVFGENVYPEIRVVMNENQVLCDPLSSYRAPIDTVDLASEQIGSHTFKDFMAMCQPPSARSDSDDEDSDDDD